MTSRDALSGMTRIEATASASTAPATGALEVLRLASNDSAAAVARHPASSYGAADPPSTGPYTPAPPPPPPATPFPARPPRSPSHDSAAPQVPATAGLIVSKY